MSPRPGSTSEWDAWIAQACAALDLDPEQIDVRAILDMTKDIAHGFDRPMAPVGAYILGLAMGTKGASADLATLRSSLVATLPEQGA